MSNRFSVRFYIVLLTFLGILAVQSTRADQTIYDDSLQNGWENWSWAAVDLNNSTRVHAGAKAIGVSGGAWQAVYLHHADFNSAAYTNLTFWINGGATGGQLLQVQALLNDTAQTAYNLPALPANTWQKFSIPLSALGAANKSNLDGFWIQDRSGAAFPDFYVDDVQLISGSGVPTNSGPITIFIDAARDRHAINPGIYGVAFASPEELADLNAPLNRSGGNATTRYNWQQNSFQTAFDWFFQSLPYSSAIPGAEVDQFITDSRQTDAEPMVTIPTIGWAADVTTNRIKRWSFSVAKYGAQTETEASRTGQPWASADAGNGISASTGRPITGNNPLDANMPVTVEFQRQWVEHLTNKWGAANSGGLRYYLLDNEPSLWHSTHRDVFPTGATMEQVRDRMIQYGTAIKAVDPGALIFGPEEWGWSGYFYSGYDQQYSATNGYSIFPDRTAHGKKDYLPWLLEQLRQTNAATGQRLLDVFSVHYYPQGGEFSTNVSSEMQLRRNRSTRSLWDTNYVDESWIGSSVHLIPRLKSWVENFYPGTKTAVTEYNWGAEEHINGATAQADILGIFGREGLDFATRWTTPASVTPTYKAMRMFRNYDGNKSGFGNISVFAQAPNPDELSAFAAVRTNDSAMTLIVVNKSFSTSSNATLNLTNFLPSSTAEVWQLNSFNAISRLADITNAAAQFSYTFPAQSITLLVFQQRVPAPPHLKTSDAFANPLALSLEGETGVSYVIEASTNLVNWTPVSTNLLSTNRVRILVPAAPQKQFYRAVWRP